MGIIWTARTTYAGADRLDIGVGSKSHFGRQFAPDAEQQRLLRPKPKTLPDVGWERYERDYHDRMAESWRRRRQVWDKLLGLEETTLVCTCIYPIRCHRSLLADYLLAAGADVQGERAAVEQARGLPDPEPRPQLRRCFALGCTLNVPAHQLFCFEHWRATPRALQADIMRLYRKGQEKDLKMVTPEYITAARAARAAVVEKAEQLALVKAVSR